LAIFDDYWQFSAIFGDFQRFSEIFAIFYRLLAEKGRSDHIFRQFSSICGKNSAFLQNQWYAIFFAELSGVKDANFFVNFCCEYNLKIIIIDPCFNSTTGADVFFFPLLRDPSTGVARYLHTKVPNLGIFWRALE
jgi:hypothetical protein